MERKALNSLGYMELAAFFVFGTFLLGLYYDIVWLQWVTAILFILPMAGVLRYPSRCKREAGAICQSSFRLVVDNYVSLFGYGIRIAYDSLNS